MFSLNCPDAVWTIECAIWRGRAMKAGWEVRTLGEVCDIARGGSPRPIQDYMTNDADGVNWIKISDATASDKYIYSTKEKIKPAGVARSRLVKEGDFLLSNSMSFGRPYILKTTGCIHDGWLVLSNYAKYFDQSYLYYLLGSDVIYQQFNNLAAGSTVRNLNIDLASRVKLGIPPLAEQQRIVSMLDQAFEHIATAKAAAQANLANAKALFESHLQAVFSQRGDGWEKVSLANCCEQIFAGGDVPTDRFSKEKTEKYTIPVIANGEKNNGLFGFTDVARVYKPSVTVSARGTIGFTCVRTSPFFPVVRLVVLIPNENRVILPFLYYAVSGMDFSNTGTSNPQLTVPNLKEQSIYLPHISKQHAFVETLDTLATQTRQLEALYQAKLSALDALKQSLLHQAFSGAL